jgi:ribosomal protein L37AE/L43A
MGKGLVFVIVAVILTAVGLIRKAVAVSRLRRMNAAEPACVACGSSDVERREGVAKCRRCGYEGRADGGGRLSSRDLGDMFDARGD